MAYEKLYTVIGFENRPSRKTPLSAETFNHIEAGIAELDARIVEMSAREDNLEERLETVETEVTPIERGGTGGTTAKEARYNLLNDMSHLTGAITDDDYYAGINQTISEDNGAIYKKKMSLLWNYIKSKISSVLGLTATNYKGTSAKATADADGNVIADTYATQTEVAKKWDSTVSRTANTVLAAPNGSNGAGTFRKLVANDLPTVPATKGGTGQTSLVNSANALINALSTGASAPTDNDYFVSQYASGGTTTTTYHRRPVSALWTYIKGKADSVYATKTSVTPVANLATTVAGKPLDATMGKALAEMISAIPTITFATEEPTEVPENTIIMVYEE